MTVQALLSLILLALHWGASSPSASRSDRLYQNSKPGCGVVKGRVLDATNHLVADVKVYSLILDRPPRGREYSTTTDAQGQFTLTCAELGKNSIYVAKEDDGYPDTFLTPFIDPKSITVVDVKNQSPARVDVRLPAKAGRLTARVMDAITKRPIEGAVLILCRADSPHDCHQMNANQTPVGFSQLIPPVPITIKASAPGYADLYYLGVEARGHASVIRIAPNTTKTLEISLKQLSR